MNRKASVWPFAAGLTLVSLGLIGWSRQGDDLRNMQRQTLASEMAAMTAERFLPLRDAWTIYAESSLSGFLNEATPEDAELALSEHLNALAKAERIGWRASKATSNLHNGLIETRISGVAVLPEAQLASFLRKLEMDTPYIFVEKAHLIRNTPTQGEKARITLNLTALAYAPIRAAAPTAKTEGGTPK